MESKQLLEDPKSFVDEKIKTWKKEFPNSLYVTEDIIGDEGTHKRKIPVLIGSGPTNNFDLSFIIQNFEEKYCPFLIAFIDHKKNANQVSSISIPITVGEKGITSSNQQTNSTSNFSNKVYVFAENIIGDQNKMKDIFKQSGYTMEFK